MNNSTDYFEELEALLKSNLSVRKKHETLFSLLKRFVNAQTSLLSTDYTGLAAQLYALCKIYQFPLTEIDLIRRRAINIAQKKKRLQMHYFYSPYKKQPNSSDASPTALYRYY